MTLKDLVLDSAKPGVIPTFGFAEDVEFLDAEITPIFSFEEDVEYYRVGDTNNVVAVFRNYYRNCDVYTVAPQVSPWDVVTCKGKVFCALINFESISDCLDALGIRVGSDGCLWQSVYDNGEVTSSLMDETIDDFELIHLDAFKASSFTDEFGNTISDELYSPNFVYLVPDRDDLVEDEFITSVLQARWLCDAL